MPTELVAGIDRWRDGYNYLAPPYTLVGTTATSVTASSTVHLGGYRYNSSSTVNDGWTGLLDLSAGTWTFQFAVLKTSSSGVATFDFSMDNGSTWTTIGTSDNYAASSAPAIASFTGVTVPSDGLSVLRYRVLSKNASSSNYFLLLSSVEALRTA